MKIIDTLSQLTSLFDEAKKKNEFEFVMTLLNYKSIGSMEVQANLHEWFDAISSYKNYYSTYSGKEQARMAALLYSTFFENSDFYNIIGSLCRIKLGFRASSYLFWKTKKNERLLGIGEKEAFLTDLLEDAGLPNIISFFKDVHYTEIRNSYFHSAYSLDNDDWVLHDSEGIEINHSIQQQFSLIDFFYPVVDQVIQFFDTFYQLYTDHFNSYKEDKVIGANPLGPTGIILGSENGLAGIRIPKAVQFYGEWHDSGIWYDTRWGHWAGHNINLNLASTEALEIADQLSRFESKTHVVKNDTAFNNLLEIIKDRGREDELARAIQVLINYGNHKHREMDDEQNHHKRNSLPKGIIPFFQKALDLSNGKFELSGLNKRIVDLEKMQKDGWFAVTS